MIYFDAHIVPDLDNGSPFKLPFVSFWHVPIFFEHKIFQAHLVLSLSQSWNQPFSLRSTGCFWWRIIFRNEDLDARYAHCSGVPLLSDLWQWTDVEMCMCICIRTHRYTFTSVFIFRPVSVSVCWKVGVHTNTFHSSSKLQSSSWLFPLPFLKSLFSNNEKPGSHYLQPICLFTHFTHM